MNVNRVPQSHQTLLPTRSSLEERLRFIEMRSKGFTIDEILQEKINQEKQNIINKANQMVQVLTARRQETETTLNDLIQEVEAVNVTQPGENQEQNLNQTIQKLKQIQTNLIENISIGNKELVEKQSERENLNQLINHFQCALHAKNSNLPFKNNLLEVGGKLCLHLSGHKFYGDK